MLLPLLAALAAASAAPAPDSSKAFPFPVELHTLPNGLRVGLVPYDSPGLVAYYTLMRVGSRNEPEPGRSGLRALLRAHDVPRHEAPLRARTTTRPSRGSA